MLMEEEEESSKLRVLKESMTMCEEGGCERVVIQEQRSWVREQ